MPNFGLFHKNFNPLLMPFIYEQAFNLNQYTPTFIQCSLLHQTQYQHIVIEQGKAAKFKKLAYTLSRSPSLFQDLDSLSHLKFLHAHFGPDGVFAMEIASQLKIPFMVTFHGYDITLKRKNVWSTGKLLYYHLLLNEKRLQQNASYFIAVSDFIREKLLEHGYADEKIIRHYIGVDTEKFIPDVEPSGQRYILCVGRHVEKKGIETALRGFAHIADKYPDVQFIQIGSGYLTAKLKQLAQTLGIEHCTQFLGGKPHEFVAKMMRGAEVFVLPSQTAENGDSEALGIVFLEASACEIPIVSTWHGGIPEIVQDGETGYLITEKDHKALAERLDTLLSDRGLAKTLGQQGRQRVCAEFDIHKQTTKLEKIYDSLC